MEFETRSGKEPPKTLAETVYRRLRNDIIWGKIPPGAPLKSDDLRRRYETGISPLREALSRLASERLAVASSQRGFRVSTMGPGNVIDIMETRILIETAALRRSIEIGDVEWETRVVAAHHALSRIPFPNAQSPESETWMQVHRAFHMELLSACGSDWQMHFAELLFDQAERFRILRAVSTDPGGHGRDPVEEHLRIVEAVLDRDADASVRALSAHYRTTMEMALESLSAGGDSVSKGLRASSLDRTTPRE